MNDRPVRLRVDDDLRRSRLTVFFRFFLTIPHFVWLGIWAFGVFFTAFAQWVITVVRGRGATPLNDFHVAFVRYTTHVGAYLSLAANPFPGFLGSPGYAVDVEIDVAERQGRLGALFRLLLATPAWLMLFALNAGGVGIWNFYYPAALYFGSVALVLGFLAWFACLVRGRMPSGVRNVIAYCMRYTAEVYAYSLLVTPVYPSTDPTMPAEAGRPPPHPIRLSVDDDRARSRLTTFFRIFLAVPHFVWLTLWSVVAFVASVAQWFYTLFAGRPAAPLHRFLASYIAYATHVAAFVFLVANPFPGFTGAAVYPVDLAFAGPERQHRLVTGFRGLLALPALWIASVLLGALYLGSIGLWVASLVRGRAPAGLRDFGAFVLRYTAQGYGYLYLVTDRYPFAGPPALPAPEQLAFDPAV